MQFFWENVICRYGIPRILVTDNGTQFNNDEFKKYCDENDIKLRFTSVAHPQANGQAEVLRKIEASGVGQKGKLAPNWEGPYRVKNVFGRGSYKLETLEGHEVPRTWHASNLKVYYV
ncbi:hypothetical protein POM88_039661 [Heracleum sosnowskyi]|uniref:Integrase catalytic domain-containing protein n=1 Tax=Heracleum sosnowskyi TaxID=360622 RepID=A0AAD8HAS5_9APIA|nr:hypothetical protein POM88_039661 [Heracleum sosnowskyi]